MVPVCRLLLVRTNQPSDASLECAGCLLSDLAHVRPCAAAAVFAVAADGGVRPPAAADGEGEVGGDGLEGAAGEGGGVWGVEEWR